MSVVPVTGQAAPRIAVSHAGHSFLVGSGGVYFSSVAPAISHDGVSGEDASVLMKVSLRSVQRGGRGSTVVLPVHPGADYLSYMGRHRPVPNVRVIGHKTVPYDEARSALQDEVLKAELARLAEEGGDATMFAFMHSPDVVALAKEVALPLYGPSTELLNLSLVRRLNNKARFVRWCWENGFPVPDETVIVHGRMQVHQAFMQAWRRRNDVSMRLAEGAGGCGSARVNPTEAARLGYPGVGDYVRSLLVDGDPVWRNEEVIVAPWTQWKESPSVTGEVFPGGSVKILYNTHQIFDKGVYAGPVISSDPLLTDEQTQTMAYVALCWGEYLAKQGYVGPFSLDSIVDPVTGEIQWVEANVRDVAPYMHMAAAEALGVDLQNATVTAHDGVYVPADVMLDDVCHELTRDGCHWNGQDGAFVTSPPFGEADKDGKRKLGVLVAAQGKDHQARARRLRARTLNVLDGFNKRAA